MRRIAVFTGNRAEYGLLYPVIKAIDEHPLLDYYLFVSGAHLDKDFGYTRKEIASDGFRVYKEVKIDFSGDRLLTTTGAIGSVIINLSKMLERLKPHFLIVYADRFEGLGAVVAGSQMGIPTAHIEGGDLTEGGALDDSVRHAMTKLSHLHFTTNEDAAERIRRLGEESWRVFNVGFPVIDLIKEGRFATEQEIFHRCGVVGNRPIIIFTQHSVTTEFDEAEEQVNPSLEALKYFAKRGSQVIITYPNNDAGGKKIISEINKLKQEKLKNIIITPNLGRYFYHGILNLCGKGLGCCAGNSSSGIKETPAFGAPAVNIGTRQNGRLRACNVIDTGYNKKEIINAIEKAIYDRSFRARYKRCKNPYGEGNSGKKIAEVLASISIDKKLIQKKITY
jgi:UDP-N-acetylglucosamine 2-epimerase (non-hydrolysing)/GDP/UDP-N,N'-diacetylbacillosamine 2-epimerase (hydrolysing)